MAKAKPPRFVPGEGEDKSHGTLYLSDRAYDMLHMLAGLGGGRVMDDLADKIDEVVAAVVDTAQKGTVTLKLNVSPVGVRNVESVIIDEAFTTKAPRLSNASQFGVDARGRIQPRNDAQLALDLIRVDADGVVENPDATH